MKLLLIDCDGVLNGHEKWPNGYCRMDLLRVLHLNSILDRVPDLQLVLTSSWRYAFESRQSIEALFLIHGANAYGRAHGCTERDPVPPDAPPFEDKEWWDRMGKVWRCRQITDYVETHEPEQWAVLDDIPLYVPNLFVCNRDVGLTAEIAEAVIRHFTAQ